ncbi:hypothetical protein KUM37_18210 [Streptomonospora sp. NEAU-YY374]|nr:hypothetical protein [Streptomonospora nanhaiensis]
MGEVAEVDVVADQHHPRRGDQGVPQQPHQQVVAQDVDTEGELEAVLGRLVGGGGLQAGVADQGRQPRQGPGGQPLAQLGRRGADAVERGEVAVQRVDVGVAGLVGEPPGHRGGGLAHRDHDVAVGIGAQQL